MKIDKFIFNEQSGDFEAIIVSDNNYSLSLCDFDKNQESEASILAQKISEWLNANLNNAKIFASTQLLSLKNETWLEEDEEIMTETQFIDALKLDAITAYSTNNFTLYFDDNEIFWGHSVVVDVNENFELDYVEIAG